jgi:hypothetical protein
MNPCLSPLPHCPHMAVSLCTEAGSSTSPVELSPRSTRLPLGGAAIWAL